MPHFPSRLAILLTCALTQSYALAADPVVIMEFTHNYAVNTLPRTAKWLGLFCDGMACEIRDTKVAIAKSTVKDILDNDEAIDVVELGESPVAVFANVPLATGKVATWYYHSDDGAESQQARLLRKLNKWTMPGGAQSLNLSWVVTPAERRHFHLSDGSTKQLVFATGSKTEYGDVEVPVVRWAGDLDGDGKLDFLVSLPGSCEFDQRLYLSTQAGEGKLVRKAAQLAGAASACGC